MIYEAVNQAVLRLVPSDARSVLDVGCGTGALGEAIKQRQLCRVVGITATEEEAHRASHSLDEVLYEDLERFYPKPGPSFDVIVCSHVLEHLRNAEQLLHNLQACAQTSSLLIVALPNALHWKQRLEFIKGSFRYTSGGIMDTTHVRFYDWSTAQSLVQNSGWTVLNAEAPGRIPLMWRNRVFGPVLNRVASRVLPGLLGEQFVITARLPSG